MDTGLSNILDKELENMLHPLTMLHSVILQPKYRISRGSILQNNIFSHILCFTGIFMAIAVNTIHILLFDRRVLSNISNFLFFTAILETLIGISFSLIMFFVNFMNKSNNVRLILLLQHFQKEIDCKEAMKKFRKDSRLSIFLLFLQIFFVIIGMNLTQFPSYTTALFASFKIYYDVNIVFGMHIIKFLGNGINLWRLEMNRFLATCSRTDHGQLRNYLTDVIIKEQKLFKAYKCIIAAFKLCGYLVHAQIFLLAINAFKEPLIHIQVYIELNQKSTVMVQNPFRVAVSTMVCVLSMLKNFSLLISTCLACQRFYQAVTDVDTACAVMRNEDRCLDNVHRLCKNVTRLNACARGAGLRTSGALSVDASLPLRLLALLATYVVVLLQFAFL